jgi:phage terminase large subunit-like protein
MYTPLNYSTSRLDGRKSNVWLSDETGAIPSSYPIDAMKSSQMNMLNRLGIIISTAYPNLSNPMTEEIEYSKQIFNGVIENDKYFALLYEPNEEIRADWQTNNLVIEQSNPLGLEISENMDYLYQQRQEAIDKPSSVMNFMCKHLNIFVNGDDYSKYIDFKKWQECSISDELFKDLIKGKEISVGCDLSITTDLTAISIEFKHEGKYYCKSIGFLPRNTLSTRREKFDYLAAERRGECIICEGDTINYTQVEDYIRGLEDMYGCKIKCISSDPYNALQLMESLSNDYEVIMFTQSYSNMSPTLKDFQKLVYDKNIYYVESKLFDFCMMNTETVEGRASSDILLNKKNKNKSRIDLCVAQGIAHSQLYLEKQSYSALDALENADW